MGAVCQKSRSYLSVVWINPNSGPVSGDAALRIRDGDRVIFILEFIVERGICFTAVVSML